MNTKHRLEGSKLNIKEKFEDLKKIIELDDSAH